MYTLQDVSANTLKLENIFSSAIEGQYFSYKELQQLTNVVMDNKGKTYIYSALRRLKLPYETVRGEGIKLLSKDNATRIVIGKIIKTDNSIKRAEKTTKQVKDRVYEQLTEPEKKNIIFLGTLFGTIRSYSQSAKRIFNNKPLLIGEKIN